MKEVDDNGFITYKDVMISREGVFPYLGKDIDPSGKNLEPNKVYKVYRPKSEICDKKFIESLERKPLVDDHTMLGELGVPAEKKGTHGVLTDVKAVGNELHGTITIWSEEMKDKIRKGKRELSLGYSGSIRKQSGRFQGEEYDFVQHNLSANHIALVDRARMGHACRLMDNALIICDSLELPKMKNADELIEELKGCSDEELAKVKDYLASTVKKPTEDEEAKKKAEEEAAKKAAEEEEAKKKAEDEAAKKKAEEEAKKVEDAKKAEEEKKAVQDAAIESYKRACDLAKKCEKRFGVINMDGISTEQELAEKICQMDSALKFVDSAKALDAVKAAIADAEKSATAKVTVTDSRTTPFSFISAFRSRK